MDEQLVDAANWIYATSPAGNGKLNLIWEANNVAHVDSDTLEKVADIVTINEIGEENRIHKIGTTAIVKRLDAEAKPNSKPIDSLKGQFF